MKPKFDIGQLMLTSNVASSIPMDDIIKSVGRHHSGDWGDVMLPQENEEALHNGRMLLSVYYTSRNVKFWIITKWDRSVTIVLFPEEY